MTKVWRAAFWLALAVVTAVTLMPSQYQTAAPRLWDKAEHFLAFAALGLLGMLAFPGRRAVLMVGLLVIYGGLIEVVQGWVGRDRDWRDLLADSLGLLAVWAIMSVVRWSRAARAS